MNGIEQPPSSGYIQDSSRTMRQQSANYDSTPPIIPPDTSNQEGKLMKSVMSEFVADLNRRHF